eukprot:TRINITY_DN2603_c0_g1_i1.p1 TRINITY_DN2603_c0_g1~~TRINITY_DN2603_c0_g1_i1.p1  ORF type:complete len:902 (-),score=251.77 TRINITY_DN2603_c0_g1_i1:112-2817(-)
MHDTNHQDDNFNTITPQQSKLIENVNALMEDFYVIPFFKNGPPHRLDPFTKKKIKKKDWKKRVNDYLLNLELWLKKCLATMTLPSKTVMNWSEFFHLRMQYKRNTFPYNINVLYDNVKFYLLENNVALDDNNHNSPNIQALDDDKTLAKALLHFIDTHRDHDIDSCLIGMEPEDSVLEKYKFYTERKGKLQFEVEAGRDALVKKILRWSKVEDWESLQLQVRETALILESVPAIDTKELKKGDLVIVSVNLEGFKKVVIGRFSGNRTKGTSLIYEDSYEPSASSGNIPTTNSGSASLNDLDNDSFQTNSNDSIPTTHNTPHKDNTNNNNNTTNNNANTPPLVSKRHAPQHQVITLYGVWINADEKTEESVAESVVYPLTAKMKDMLRNNPESLVNSPDKKLISELREYVKQELQHYYSRMGADVDLIERPSSSLTIQHLPAIKKTKAFITHLLSHRPTDLYSKIDQHAAARISSFISSLGPRDLYTPSRAYSLKKLQSIIWSQHVAEVRMSRTIQTLQEGLDAIAILKKNVLEGTKKKDLSEWWLTLIKDECDKFLERRGFVMDAIGANYLEIPPENPAAIKANVGLIKEILDPKRDVHGVKKNLIERLKDTIYPEIDRYVGDVEIVLAEELDWEDWWEEKYNTATTPKFNNNNNTNNTGSSNNSSSGSSSGNGKEMDMDEARARWEERVKTGKWKKKKEEEIDEMIKDIEYLKEMKRLEKKENSNEKILNIVPVTGLIVGRFYRLDNELRTCIEVWSDYFESNPPSNPSTPSLASPSTPSTPNAGSIVSTPVLGVNGNGLGNSGMGPGSGSGVMGMEEGGEGAGWVETKGKEGKGGGNGGSKRGLGLGLKVGRMGTMRNMGKGKEAGGGGIGAGSEDDLKTVVQGNEEKVKKTRSMSVFQ